MQLEKDTDPSFQKIEAPQAEEYLKFRQNGEIIGYLESQINSNQYEVRKLKEVLVTRIWLCLRKLTDIYSNFRNEICTIQQLDANESRMVRIHKVN